MRDLLTTDEEIIEMKKHYRAIKEIVNSLADNATSYREISRDILDIEYHNLSRIINDAEKTLLIRCYTYMEQTIKKLYYQCLKGHNQDIDIFVNKKLPEDKFSPNVKLENLKNALVNELNINLPFIKLNNEYAKKYDILIDARHKYSHGNNYIFIFDNYKEIISFIGLLNYIVRDYKIAPIKRQIFEEKLPELTEKLEAAKKNEASYEKIPDEHKPDYKVREREENFVEVQLKCKEIRSFLKKELKNKNIKNIDLLKKIYKKLKKLNKYELTNNSCEEFIDEVIKELTLN